MNAYFPQDPKTDIINENDFNEFIWNSNINTDFGRKTRLEDLVETYVSDSNLIRLWEQFDVDFTRAHNSGNIMYTSTIDHFLRNLNV